MIKNIATVAILTSALVLPITYAQQDHHGVNQAVASGISEKPGSMKDGMGTNRLLRALELVLQMWTRSADHHPGPRLLEMPHTEA